MGLALAVIATAPASAQQDKSAAHVAPAAPAAPAAEITPEDLTAFVRALAADALGAADTAAAGYSIALGDVPNDPQVAILAYRQGLAAGDIALASRASAALVAASAAPPDAAIFDAAVALKAHDNRALEAALSRMGNGPLDFMVPVFRAWTAFGAGEDPLPWLDPDRGGPLARRYASEHHALLLLATGKTRDGLAELAPLLAGIGGADLRIDAAFILAGTGKRDEARTLLAAGGPVFAPVRDAIGSGTRPSAAFGVARLLNELAAEIAQEDASPLSILLTRSALLLDPGDDRARVYLAEALSKAGSDRMAMDVLAQVKPNGGFARSAAAGRISALSRAGRVSEAIVEARALARERDATVFDIKAYADLLAQDGQYDAAAAAYADAMARFGGDGSWALNFLRGKALNNGGHWREAQPLLHRAATLGSDEVEILTYYGMALVEHREDLAEAQAMLERAQKLKPDDSQIADALAWTYFLRGDAARALPMLESAAQADPGGSEVNEHLGDVYWRLGRHYEARYAWRAAAIYADAGAATRIADKLANGLSAAN